MTEIRRRDDLRALIKELEERQTAESSAQTPSKAGFVSVKEAATMLNVNEDTVRKLVRRGDLTTARIGRRKYIVEADLNKYWDKADRERQIKMANPNRLLTVSEVAEILRFSEAQVYDMLNKKIILGFRVGAGAGSWRIQRKDLDEYVARQRGHALKNR